MAGAALAILLSVSPALAQSPIRGSPYERSYERQYDYGRRQLEPDFWELRDRFGQVVQDRFGLGYERGGPDDRLYRYQYDRSGWRNDDVEGALKRAELARRGLLDAPLSGRRDRAPLRVDPVWRDKAFDRFGFSNGDPPGK
ncbi:MAG: hypothetical protein CMM50_08820 [Rhodospirillaceae bacterium]|nr:hypothetical protein [Rhodospirillaceae bacterium]